MNFGIARALAGVDSFTELEQLLRLQRIQRGWALAGKPAPVPHSVKVRNILAVADLFGIKVLVETGTHTGNTLSATLNHFDRLYSIEIYEPFVVAARKRFAAYSKVSIVQGDSANVLPSIVECIQEPALFWLDGHYSGEGTGRGVQHSPIVAEIEHIGRLRPPGRDAIIIDDARLFGGENGYPSLDEFLARLETIFGTIPRCANDAIFILPR